MKLVEMDEVSITPLHMGAVLQDAPGSALPTIAEAPFAAVLCCYAMKRVEGQDIYPFPNFVAIGHTDPEKLKETILGIVSAELDKAIREFSKDES